MTLSIPSRILLLPLVYIILFAIFATAAFAQDTRRPGQPTTTGERLSETRLRSCQAREDAMKQKMSQLTRLATNMVTKFDAISLRVQNHYTNTVAPRGKTVPKYDSLIADIAAKKSAVDSALRVAQDDVSSFLCTGTDPRGQLTQFRTDMQLTKQALKDYRTSIKNLIVAIRSVTGDTKRNEAE